jgi:hypothetical protein
MPIYQGLWDAKHGDLILGVLGRFEHPAGEVSGRVTRSSL